MLKPEAPHRIHTPVMFQRWDKIAFLHWRYEAEYLQSLLPPGITVDSFDDTGWVSLTPFLLDRLRPPFFPPVPWFSRFPEMNLRTYVVGPDGPGIWFFSLDAASLPAVVGARATYGLPYYWAHMWLKPEGPRVDYYSARGNRAGARIIVEWGQPLLRPDELAIFLTARFRLYSLFRGRLAWARVEHQPWRLCQASLLRFEESVRRAAGLRIPEAEPLVHFSPGVDVRIGRLRISPRASEEVARRKGDTGSRYG
jgi:uncharacterized protein YqjF (DUF2071 family)